MRVYSDFRASYFFRSVFFATLLLAGTSFAAEPRLITKINSVLSPLFEKEYVPYLKDGVSAEFVVNYDQDADQIEDWEIRTTFKDEEGRVILGDLRSRIFKTVELDSIKPEYEGIFLANFAAQFNKFMLDFFKSDEASLVFHSQPAIFSNQAIWDGPFDFGEISIHSLAALSVKKGEAKLKLASGALAKWLSLQTGKKVECNGLSLQNHTQLEAEGMLGYAKGQYRLSVHLTFDSDSQTPLYHQFFVVLDKETLKASSLAENFYLAILGKLDFYRKFDPYYRDVLNLKALDLVDMSCPLAFLGFRKKFKKMAPLN